MLMCGYKLMQQSGTPVQAFVAKPAHSYTLVLIFRQARAIYTRSECAHMSHRLALDMPHHMSKFYNIRSTFCLSTLKSRLRTRETENQQRWTRKVQALVGDMTKRSHLYSPIKPRRGLPPSSSEVEDASEEGGDGADIPPAIPTPGNTFNSMFYQLK
eukprot:636838-Prorocentrum_minimum.AAC.2